MKDNAYFQWLLVQGTYADYLKLTEEEKIKFEMFKSEIVK